MVDILNSKFIHLDSKKRPAPFLGRHRAFLLFEGRSPPFLRLNPIRGNDLAKSDDRHVAETGRRHSPAESADTVTLREALLFVPR